MEKWIVLYLKNARIASFELTNENEKNLQKTFVLCLIQQDITGTKHYNVLGLR